MKRKLLIIFLSVLGTILIASFSIRVQKYSLSDITADNWQKRFVLKVDPVSTLPSELYLDNILPDNVTLQALPKLLPILDKNHSPENNKNLIYYFQKPNESSEIIQIKSLSSGLWYTFN